MSETYVETLQVIQATVTPTVPKLPRLTNRQMEFLRHLRKHPNSLPLMTWPRATTLRKWMRRPRFRRAIEGLEEAFQVEARLVMAGSAAAAAGHLQAALTGGSKENSGCYTTPDDLRVFDKPIKNALAVLWAEMARREQFRKSALQQEILRRMGNTTPDEDPAPEYVI